MATYLKGVTDPYVIKIQRVLNKDLNMSLKKDGNLGSNTGAALARWQAMHGLRTTGFYDERTASVMDPIIEKLYLGEKDFKAAAELLSVPVARVKAVQSVESSGYGFFDNGTPTLLFERHVFKRQIDNLLDKQDSAKDRIIANAGIHIAAGQQLIPTIKAYLATNFSDIYNSTPGGYSGGSAEYSRVVKAAQIEHDCAFQSASWGLFQIMGYHYQKLGYSSVNDMVEQFTESEGNQLTGFCKFIMYDANMHKALKSGDFATFARLYNGPNYKINNYDTKIAQAESQFSKVTA